MVHSDLWPVLLPQSTGATTKTLACNKVCLQRHLFPACGSHSKGRHTTQQCNHRVTTATDNHCTDAMQACTQPSLVPTATPARQQTFHRALTARTDSKQPH
jgi:hypothetical protein